jgi:hypothetical protein
MSGKLYRPVVIAMIAMRVVQPSVCKVIDVVAVRDCLVSARRAMRVT